MKKIVLTGGPCSGKSTVIEIIKNEYEGKLVIVPEMATTLLSGFPVPGKDIKWTIEWQASFQTAVVVMQKEAEKSYAIKAAQKSINLVVCDRGLLDGAAYTPGGLEEFSNRYAVQVDKALKEYEAIIHLESLAAGVPEYYGDTNNSLRFESREEAVRLEYATMEAWSRHPNHIFVSCKNGLEGKICKVREMVSKLLESNTSN